MCLSVRCLSVALLISWSFPALAQERVAFTSVDEAGADYLVQGEYRGAVRLAGVLRSSSGLQLSLIHI